jgi:glycine dehydrogenase subunit 1
MEYVQTTPEEAASMLRAIGVPDLETLFKSIPPAVRFRGKLNVPSGLSEAGVVDLLAGLARRNIPISEFDSFLGAGKYHGYVPAVVDALACQSEFYTAYTPYQAEASQGNLQATFEYQTMVCELTGMDASNASHYDGGTALAEAIGMAIEHTDRRRVVVSGGIHPEWLRVVRTFFRERDFEFAEVPLENGRTSPAALEAAVDSGTACVAIQQPNFLGFVEELEPIAKVAERAGALATAAVEPISLGLLKPPGHAGFQIAVGDGQPLGVDLMYGGPTFGFMACRMDLIRRLPGRIVGETKDHEGKRGFVLTLQAREQHIRREKATSNICTNQALMAHFAAVYLSALGRQGFPQVARRCLDKAHYLADRLRKVAGLEPAFPAPFFREFPVRLPHPPSQVVSRLLPKRILAGVDLGRFRPAWKDLLLVSASELTRREQIDRLAAELKEALRP